MDAKFTISKIQTDAVLNHFKSDSTDMLDTSDVRMRESLDVNKSFKYMYDLASIKQLYWAFNHQIYRNSFSRERTIFDEGSRIELADIRRGGYKETFDVCTNGIWVLLGRLLEQALENVAKDERADTAIRLVQDRGAEMYEYLKQFKWPVFEKLFTEYGESIYDNPIELSKGDRLSKEQTQALIDNHLKTAVDRFQRSTIEMIASNREEFNNRKVSDEKQTKSGKTMTSKEYPEYEFLTSSEIEYGKY